MDGVKFTLDLSSGGAAKLRECVKAKLSEYIGNYTDDVLVEYVVVLVGHGKERAQAVNDLEAFLGGDSDSFVSWLWDHMSANKHSYVKTEDDKRFDAGLADEDTQAQGEPSLRSVVAVVEPAEETTIQMDFEEQPDGPGTGGAAKPDDINTGVEVDHSSRRRGRRRDGVRRSDAKRSRSPEIWTRRGRGRADRPDMKEMSPPVVKASRRLLINAVREVVNESALLATKKDALKRTESAKRLQSVVSSDADVQGNGGADFDMTHEDSPVRSELVAMEELHVNRTSKFHERQTQEKPASVWDRINLNDRNRQSAFAAEGEFDAEEVIHSENRGKWKKNAAAVHRAGLGKGRGSREQRHRGGAQYPGRKVNVNGNLLGDALRRVNTEQMQNQDNDYRRNGLNSKKQVGQRPGNELSQGNGETGEDGQPINEDVLEMKKRLRQVQLDMTKLRARQAEVSKEVQNSPAAVLRPIPFDPQPSQEDINDRSVFVTNVHFAATEAALRVHFGRCGNIKRVTILLEPTTGKPKGSAYVEFTTKDAVENALSLNDTALLSRNLKVMPKTSAIAEMNPIPVPSSSFLQPPFSRGYPREHMPPQNLYPARRPIGLPMPHMGTSNLKWKRDASTPTANSTAVTPPTDVEMVHSGPVRFSRSLSYVRVAPYATQGTTGEAQKPQATT
ncbi:hypothetical protein M758_1G114600 [Ceratodon purpureus]|nr:hypothetical protein M758_1G114600 [Ceratodon purpureus]